MKRYLIMYKLFETSQTEYIKVYAKSLGDAEYNAFDVLKTNCVYCLDGTPISSGMIKHNRK